MDVVSVVQVAGVSCVAAVIVGYVAIPFVKAVIKERRENQALIAQMKKHKAELEADIAEARASYAARKKMTEEGNQRYVKFKAMTDPCPHCLGTGRLPKEGFSFTEQAMQEFNIDRAMSQVPEPFLKAFEDEEKAEGGDS